MSRTDLRPGPSARFFGRSFKHLTPRYLYYRGRSLLRARLRPDEPSLTPDSLRLLGRFLTPTDRGVEWGSGNSTRWLARRTLHLTSFETDPNYYPIVHASLAREGLTNVDHRLLSYDDEFIFGEDAMHDTDWVRAAEQLEDESLDYALVDSSPRGCLCARVIGKLRPGGILVLDNANWYLPPPRDVRPAPGSTGAVMGSPGSTVPHRCWPAFASAVSTWRSMWTSDGVQMTLILLKPANDERTPSSPGQ